MFESVTQRANRVCRSAQFFRPGGLLVVAPESGADSARPTIAQESPRSVLDRHRRACLRRPADPCTRSSASIAATRDRFAAIRSAWLDPERSAVGCSIASGGLAYRASVLASSSLERPR